MEYKDEHGYWYGAVSTRLQMWYVLSIAVSYMSLFLSLSTVLDLYLVLKNPFSSSQKRIKKFVVVSIFFSFLFASLGLVLTKDKNYFVSELNTNMYMAIAVCNLVVACVVMILVLIRFRKKGMNQNIKKQI